MNTGETGQGVILYMINYNEDHAIHEDSKLQNWSYRTKVNKMITICSIYRNLNSFTENNESLNDPVKCFSSEGNLMLSRDFNMPNKDFRNMSCKGSEGCKEVNLLENIQEIYLQK